MDSQKNDFCSISRLSYFSDGVDAVQSRHRDINDQDIRCQFLGRVTESLPIIHCTDDLKLRFEKVRNSFLHRFVIVCQQYTDAGFHCGINLLLPR